MKPAWIVIACDCDPDSPTRGGASYDWRGGLCWRGIREGIPRLLEMTDTITEKTGIPIVFTWCVRSDSQMTDIYGEAAWAVLEFADLWEELERRGHEIGWHPHLWRWTHEEGCWYQEVQDEEWIRECLHVGFEAMVRSGWTPRATRMGWEFHSNVTMRTLDALGIRFDLSAVPGSYQPGERSDGSCFHKFWDWRGTPREPYHPSKADYRRPAEGDEQALDIWEIPRRAGVPRVWKLAARGLQAVNTLKRLSTRAIKRRPNTRTATMHACNITLNPAIFRPFIAEWIREAPLQKQPLLVTSFHADELLPARGLSGWKYDLRWAQSNLLELIRVCQRARLEPRFVSPRGLFPLLQEGILQRR